MNLQGEFSASQKTGLWPSGLSHPPLPGRAANARGRALVLRGSTLRVWGESPVLGARRSELHRVRAPLALPMKFLEAAHCAPGDMHTCSGRHTCPAGHASRFVSLPGRAGRLNAFALTIPFARRCPRPPGLPQVGEGCRLCHGVRVALRPYMVPCGPIPPPQPCDTRSPGRVPVVYQ